MLFVASYSYIHCILCLLSFVFPTQTQLLHLLRGPPLTMYITLPFYPPSIPPRPTTPHNTPRSTMMPMTTDHCLPLSKGWPNHLRMNLPLINIPFTPKLFFFETTFSLNMPLRHHISISVQALTPKLNQVHLNL